MKLINDHIDAIKRLCDQHNVKTMYLFGSALNSKFNKDSDLDFLVKFRPIELAGYFDNYINFKASLSELFDRDIDLVKEQALKNPVLIKLINDSKELIYG